VTNPRKPLKRTLSELVFRDKLGSRETGWHILQRTGCAWTSRMSAGKGSWREAGDVLGSIGATVCKTPEDGERGNSDLPGAGSQMSRERIKDSVPAEWVITREQRR
jgi:hypothetical protein